MADPRAPGVYIEEISSGSRPIRSVGTRTAAFLGRAPNTEAENEPVAVDNWSEFQRKFINGGNKGDANGSANGSVWTNNHLAHAVQGFFLNGGSRCYIVNLAKRNLTLKKGLEKLEAVDEVAIVAAPGMTDKDDYEELIAHCEKMLDRVAILDGPPAITQETRQILEGNPPPKKQPKTPPDPEAKTPSAWDLPNRSARGYAAMYVPWIEVRNPDTTDTANPNRTVPPSGHIAGVWARSDATRGVHKAPANEPLRGALALQYAMTDEIQARMNDNNINCIRDFSNDGILVWGARTFVAKSETAWQYLNVRRLFNMIEESIQEGTRWIVFEPNSYSLWQAIERDVSAFLMGFWREGALMGRTPEQAFYVKCNEETNPPDQIKLGFVNIEIGLAAVRPAEFVIFKIRQIEAGAKIEQGG